MNISLQDQHALVCGSSQGIGLGIATAFANAGAKVTLVARNESKLKNIINSLPGDGHQYLAADFADEQNVQKVVDFIENNPVDILINNTGGPAPGPITEADPVSFQNALNMHLVTSHKLVQACLPSMKQKRFGRIVNIISTSVKIPINGLGVSNTTRMAMAGWSKTLSNEVAKYGVTVNNILPGFIKTDRLDSLIQKLANDAGVSFDEMAAQMESTVPAGRFGSPEEIAHTVTFLCSAYGSYINGTNIPVDGGKTGSL